MIKFLKKYTHNIIILAALCIAYFMSDAIWSFDSASYYRVDINRFPMYTLWLRAWELLSLNHYREFIVIAQFIIGGLSIAAIFKTFKKTYPLPYHTQYLLLIPLLFPYFSPLLIAHNLTSEGLAYPLYLWLISYSIQFLFLNSKQHLWKTIFVFLALCFTRGQFIIITPILGFTYLLYSRKKDIKRVVIGLNFLLLILSPIASKIIDATYHKVVHGFFTTTPYSYVGISTLPLYVSNASDRTDIKDKHAQHLFTASYNTIDSLGITSANVSGKPRERYMVFHNNFPVICNQNFHKKARDYFKLIDATPHYSSIPAEQVAKKLTYILIKNNWKEYLTIYWEGFIHGFKFFYIMILLLIIAVTSFLKVLSHPNKANSLTILAGLLIFSNALIVGIACHSIQRYLFYNYFMAVLMCLLFFKQISKIYDR